jgi:LPXTG-site transpeptidase (sortase) family protein
MDLLWSPHKLKQKVRKNMKHFSPLQIAALAVLTVIVVALAIVAFVTGKNHAADTVDISHPTTTPEVFKIEIAGDTNTPSPVPIPMSTATLTAFPSASPTSSAKPSSGKQTDTFCTLTIGGNDIPVRYGVDEKTLEKSPGYLPSSALPGAEGICAIYGHRNRNHFKVLKGAEVGDSIKVTMADGTVYTYAITNITIYESTSEWTLPATEGKTLVLVTCYPFQYSGHAPGKCVVTARLK